MDNNHYIEIINQAHTLLENNDGFHQNTSYLQFLTFKGLSDEDHDKLRYKFKAIRQDYAKILTVMNSVKMTYLLYSENQYKSLYVSAMNDQATSELGGMIEYMFVRYRVMLEYIQQILEICIPTTMDDSNLKRYKNAKGGNKYKILLEYISQNISEEHKPLKINCFKNLIANRNLLIHRGATCLVYGDKENLLFEVLTIDAMDKEEKLPVDSFFSNKRGLIYYHRYWALQIAELIVFSKTIFSYLSRIGTMSKDAKEIHSFFHGHKAESPKEIWFTDINGKDVPNKEFVLFEMLGKVKALSSYQSC